MRVEKEKRKVTIIGLDDSLLSGFVHINPGERVIDFFNDEKESFIAVTDALFQNLGPVHSFKLYNDLLKKRPMVILNKSTIKWIEEVRD
jgi:hypothetical protein